VCDPDNICRFLRREKSIPPSGIDLFLGCPASNPGIKDGKESDNRGGLKRMKCAGNHLKVQRGEIK